jgi:hypothetical protein
MSNQTIVVIILVYLGINILAYFIQEFFIFKPEKLSEDFEFKYEFPFEELNFTISEKEKINGLRFFTEEKENHGVVVYFHGNNLLVYKYVYVYI